MLCAWPALIVKGTFSKDEMVVVEVEGRRIVEKHLADLTMEGLLVKIDLELQLFGRSFHIFPEFEKVALAREPIWLKQDFVFAVMNYVVAQMLGLRVLAYVLVHCSNCSMGG